MSGDQRGKHVTAEDSIKVVCRLRPLNETEEKAGSKFICTFPTGIEDNCLGIGNKIYIFDKVFKPSDTQEKVYNEAAKSIVSGVLSGFNGTIFAYGQTSSGKTHTMEGVIGDSVKQGIVPRIASDIFNHIYNMEENLEFHIKVSYFEIYMDKIRDLLDVLNVNLSVHEDKNRVPFVKGATERFVSSPQEISEIIQEGKVNRHISVTNMNEHSSRSHSVFLINLQQEDLETHRKLSSKLYLVDLAGSEKVSKTGAEGIILDEAKNINKSLSALGNVISALADANKTHIPYRDSKLTRILQESLGGNARTRIIICCSPTSFNEAETRSTLEFGKRAKTIKNVVHVNEELSAEEWKRRYEREKAKEGQLRGSLERMETELYRWRSGEIVCEEQRVNLHYETDDDETPISRIAYMSPSLVLNPFPASMRASTFSSLSREEHSKLRRYRENLYQKLDERALEIDRQRHFVDRMEEQILEQEEVIASIRRNYHLLQQEMNRTQRENESAKEEMKEVLQALEELAINYKQKSQEVENKNKEYEIMNKELTQKQSALNKTSSELQKLKDLSANQSKQIGEMLTNLLKDLKEISVSIGNEGDIKLSDDSDRKLEEELTVARLYISKMKSEVKNLVQRCQGLETFHEECKRKINQYKQDLTDCKLLISQHEARMKTLENSIWGSEEENCSLEVDADVLRLQFSKSKSEVKTHAMKDKMKDGKEDVDMNQLRGDKQFVEFQDPNQEPVAALRNKIMEKQTQINELTDLNKKYVVAFDEMQQDYERLKLEHNRTEEKYQQLVLFADRQEMDRRDLNFLESRVTNKLQLLQNMRKLFVQDLQMRLKAPSTSKNEHDCEDSFANKLKIRFLEKNLEHLTKVRKQLMLENANLRSELPKLDRKLCITMERVKSLELALKTAKAHFIMNDKYQEQMGFMRATARRECFVGRGHGAQIAKPIRSCPCHVCHRSYDPCASEEERNFGIKQTFNEKDESGNLMLSDQ